MLSQASGVNDHRVVDVGATCYPSQGGARLHGERALCVRASGVFFCYFCCWFCSVFSYTAQVAHLGDAVKTAHALHAGADQAALTHDKRLAELTSACPWYFGASK